MKSIGELTPQHSAPKPGSNLHSAKNLVTPEWSRDISGYGGRSIGNQTYVSTLQMTPADWLAFRMNGIGGSEVGAIRGTNPYKSAAEVFHEKIGLRPTGAPSNAAMFFGTELEDLVAKWWMSHDFNDEEAYMCHVAKGHRLRKCRRVNAYVIHKDYPWLIASPDRIIVGSGNPLEVKTIAGRAAAMYEDGHPPYWIDQMTTYGVVLEKPEAELAAVNLDDRIMSVSVHDVTDTADLLAVTEAFWQDVIKARPIAAELIAERNKVQPDESKMADLDAAILEMEPAAGDTKAYEAFMRDRYKQPLESRMALPADLAAVRAERAAADASKATEKLHQAAKNELIKCIGPYEALDCGGVASVTFKPNARGSKVLRVKLKEQPAPAPVAKVVSAKVVSADAVAA